MSNRIDISDPLSEVCARLGLEPRLVGELVITPSEAVATVYKLRDGSKFIDFDGNAATETVTFKVLS